MGKAAIQSCVRCRRETIHVEAVLPLLKGYLQLLEHQQHELTTNIQECRQLIGDFRAAIKEETASVNAVDY